MYIEYCFIKIFKIIYFKSYTTLKKTMVDMYIHITKFQLTYIYIFYIDVLFSLTNVKGF